MMQTTWQLPELPLPPGKSAADFPIPDRLNVWLSGMGFAAAAALLWAGSLRPEWGWALGTGIVFSYAMLFVYSLIHQAQHDCLHSKEAWNYGLGAMLSLLFPAPFTMIRTTHQGHHLRNRTDHEMFDQYYPTDNRFLKVAQFYCILIGLFWPVIPIGGLLAAISPRIFRLPVFQRGRNTSYLLGDIRPEQTTAIRLEMLLIVLLFAGLFALFRLRWENVLIMYGCFAVNWSTRQYVSHAFTRRDIIDGALNLRTNRLMSLLLLNGEWDLNHHRYPMVAWPHLPALSSPGEERVNYGQQYWRQWLGPKLCTEPPPERLGAVQLSLWEKGSMKRET
jgi:fatty acid desaturase